MAHGDAIVDRDRVELPPDPAGGGDGVADQSVDELAEAIPPGYMSGSGAIRRSGVSAVTFIEACLAGRIRSETFADKVRGFSAEDVEAWIASLRTEEA